jgi:hypothetical protein
MLIYWAYVPLSCETEFLLRRQKSNETAAQADLQPYIHLPDIGFCKYLHY